MVSFSGFKYVQRSEEMVSLLGDVYKVILDKEDTGGAFGLIECVIEPENGPPPHLNRHEDLTWYILEGELTFAIGSERVVATPGTCVFISRQIQQHHTYKNTGSTTARALLGVSPAGFEGYLREAGTEFEVNQPRPASSPVELERALELAGKYGIDVYLGS